MRLGRADIEALSKKGHAGASKLLAQLGEVSTKSGAGNKGTQFSLCDHLAAQLDRIGAPSYRWAGHKDGEYQFYDGRRWRFDFYFPDYQLAIEVEGGVNTHRRSKATSKAGNEYMVQSRHLTPAGFEEDAVKYFAASLKGITVIRVSSKMVSDDRAIGMVVMLLEARGWSGPEKGAGFRSGYRSVISNFLNKG